MRVESAVVLAGATAAGDQSRRRRWDFQPDVDGDVASHFHIIDMIATVFGTPRNGLFVITDTRIHGDHGWQVWRRHSTPLAAGGYPRERRPGS